MNQALCNEADLISLISSSMETEPGRWQTHKYLPTNPFSTTIEITRDDGLMVVDFQNGIFDISLNNNSVVTFRKPSGLRQGILKVFAYHRATRVNVLLERARSKP